MIGAYLCGALALVCLVAAVRDVRFPFGRVEEPPGLSQEVRQEPRGEQPERRLTLAEVAQASQLVFDEAPPELANMSPASLTELFAGKTDAQADTLMKQHVGKPVRVSGEVSKVEFGQISQVVLDRDAPVSLLLFFDADDYDAKPLLLALNKGDKIVASGQIYKIHETTVSLDNCKLIEARGRVS